LAHYEKERVRTCADRAEGGEEELIVVTPKVYSVLDARRREGWIIFLGTTAGPE